MPITSIKLRNRLKKDHPDLKAELKPIRVNGQMRGCSGFISDPVTDRVAYVQTEPSVYNNLGILCRQAASTSDYASHGFRNNFVADDLDALVEGIEKILDR